MFLLESSLATACASHTGSSHEKAFTRTDGFGKRRSWLKRWSVRNVSRRAASAVSTCHDPHSHDSASNSTSVKFPDQPDLMCTGCHKQFQDAVAVARHSHHAADSEGSRCVSCHMPRIMDALLFRARYHQIDDIPNAEMTKRFGQEESPNACLMCHTKKDADWVQAQLSSWKVLQGDRR